MPPRSTNPILAHEIAYLLLWLGLAIGLIVTGSMRAADGGLLLLQAAVLVFLIVKGGGDRWFQARLWFPVVALNLTYFWMGDAIPRLQAWRADESLWSIDRFFFGDCLAVKVAPFVPGWLRELLSLSYLAFFPLWTLALAVACARGRQFQRAYFSGFHLVYAIGFAGYSLFPAAGPFRYPPLAERLAGLERGGIISAFNERIVRDGCNGVDVFPSLHTAITVFVLLSGLSISRRLFAVLAVPCFLIIAATIGLQYHYTSDLVAGTLLGGMVWWFTVRRRTGIRGQTAPHRSPPA